MRALARRVLGRATTPAPPVIDNFIESLDDVDRRLLERVTPYSMTSPQRLVAIMDAVDYLTRREVPGAFVECGVWRGGSILTMILRLQQLGVEDRDIYLYDTFAGMTAPTEHDRSAFEREPASATWAAAQADGTQPWDYFFGTEFLTLEKVRDLVLSSGYPPAKVHFMVGKVEETIPEMAPPEVALLRLDTDWYESTHHELVHLYPRLVDGGVLIIDDYGHWEGCRRAVDEYFSTVAPLPMLGRLDYTGRLAVKR